MNRIPQVTIPLDSNCRIVEITESGIVLIEKSTNVMSHPNRKPSSSKVEKTLLKSKFCFEQECYLWMNEKGEEERLHLCHRLDSATSGLIVGCLDNDLAKVIRKKFANREVSKSYLAITSGFLAVKCGTWKDPLIEKRIQGKLRVQKGGNQIAITKFRKIRSKSGKMNLELLELFPVTGRTHQLRVQCMFRKVPIVGDKTYGDFATNRKVQKSTKIKRLCLHSSKINFETSFNGNRISVNAESPIPRQMGRLLI